jgi:hypothetical protein
MSTKQWNPHPVAVAFWCGAYCGALGAAYVILLWLAGTGGCTVTIQPH